MSTSKQIDKLCLAAVALSLVLTVLFMLGGSLGLRAAARSVQYESSLFDDSYVHKIDIVMDDWEGFLQSCENEEYAACTVVVDGRKHANIGIRAKGNTSLSSVRSMGSRRYSFKLEFDHYESGKTLDGLDKLCLNNLIQDNTMMKDYLVYRMMGDFGADSPLCSFAWITVNGADWGLYLAVEGVEDSFLERNYGSDAGELYKPDSMSFGGGRGNGKDFNMEDFDFESAGQQPQNAFPNAQTGRPGREGQQGGFPGGQFPGGQFPGAPGAEGGFPGGAEGGFPGGQFPGGAEGNFPGGQFPGRTEEGREFRPGGAGSPGGMGSDDVKLKYIDDDPDSYSNIFNSAKTALSTADRQRLIAALKQLSAYEDPEEVLDAEEVLRYFVVHNFVCNGDSYTGRMIHNYYLHERDGKLGMIPWDYNLAFGAFQGGSAASAVNESIDNPVSDGSPDDRPMVGWIFSDEAITARYHTLFAEFLDRWFRGGELEARIAETAALLRPYVERDPTKFCTAEQFDAGTAALRDFVALRAEAVRRQLDGDSTPVEAGSLQISDMGSMGGRGGPGGGDSGAAFPGGESGGFPGALPGGENSGSFPGTFPDGGAFPGSAPPTENGQTPPDFSGGRGNAQRPGSTTETLPAERQPAAGSAAVWPLVGASVLALAAGIFLAVKKK